MKDQQISGSERAIAQGKLKAARSNLLLMIVLTLLNIVLLFFKADYMLLFSATVPYFSVAVGMVSEISRFLIVGICLAAIILLAYLLCWIFSKKHYGWMIAALVLFIIDSLFMIGIYVISKDFSGVLDVVIHIWVLYYLVIGVKYGYRLKLLPKEEETEAAFEEEIYGEELPAEEAPGFDYSAPLRRADEDVKYRVLLENDSLGHHICYRRVKRVNELVIDGYVYDDVEMLIESAHALEAKIDGHAFQVGFDGLNIYLRVDGSTVVKKLRLI